MRSTTWLTRWWSLGDWDAAEAELTQANAAGELAGHEAIALRRAELAALRGDAATAEAILAVPA